MFYSEFSIKIRAYMSFILSLSFPISYTSSVFAKMYIGNFKIRKMYKKLEYSNFSMR